MRLSELPHPVLAYRTLDMEGHENPWMSPVVSFLTIDDGGEPVALVYVSPRRRPELKHLAKALIKHGAGAAALRWVGPDSRQRQLAEEIARLTSRWSESDLEKAFAPRRGEGYYRVDGKREKYYDGTITE